MSVDLVLRRISIHYDDYEEDHWLLFESGSLSHPLLVLTNLEMKRLVEQYAEKQREKGSKHVSTNTHGK